MKHIPELIVKSCKECPFVDSDDIPGYAGGDCYYCNLNKHTMIPREIYLSGVVDKRCPLENISDLQVVERLPQLDNVEIIEKHGGFAVVLTELLTLAAQYRKSEMAADHDLDTTEYAIKEVVDLLWENGFEIVATSKSEAGLPVLVHHKLSLETGEAVAREVHFDAGEVAGKLGSFGNYAILNFDDDGNPLFNLEVRQPVSQ